jgi:PAS domain S-box-containing protein
MSTTAWARWASRSGRASAVDRLAEPDVPEVILAALDELPHSWLTVFDVDLRLLLVRGTVLRRAGVDGGDLEGRLLHETLPWPVTEPFRSFYRRALDGERVVEEVSSDDGSRHYLVRVSALHGRSGDVVGGISVGSDITQHRRDLEALRVSEERYRLLAENSNDFVMRTTPDGVIEWISPSIVDVLGWEPEEMVGRHSLDFAHPSLVAQVRSDIAEVNRGGMVTGRLQVLCKDGGYRWMDRTLRPLYDEAGEVVARVSGWHDVQLEVEMQARLEASHERFRLAMDTSSVGMFICAPSGEFRRVNPALCTMLGRSAEDLERMSLIDVVAPDAADSLRALVARAQDGAPHATERTRFVRRTGAIAWVDVSVAVTREPDGGLGHVMGQAVEV